MSSIEVRKTKTNPSDYIQKTLVSVMLFTRNKKKNSIFIVLCDQKIIPWTAKALLAVKNHTS